MKLLFLSLFLFLMAFSQEVRVSAIVQGRVERVYVKEGQRVNKGDLLVSIDPVLYKTQRDSLKAQLSAQKIALEKVERDFKRYEELFNRGLLSRSEYEDWKSKYERELYQHESIRAQLERVEKLIEYCTLRSPIKGVVKRLFVREDIFINGTQNPEVLLLLEEK
ncbi:MAG: efflux RND transporter periplasmic adaptor subunit [Aquificaceae bacterium]|nr:efflux RND transporter periplasmic adaptor subunit [Aquificaceae bacterium]MCS7196503.1 efflux RND transporter periplasmic adaptor subunit [Aquificaceae bacterium]MCX7989534.1 efflux RND transporter periplasmic adaptor subunit [Aquificaceae bacterium]MDW8032698.1 efflux RND transporter periplasmic adaptor subunit [Aquificaceae bacterium]MDW8294506.1 efflux RND transporter periplasmic adaptor subunit [Aquificaceae bacterium]